MALKPCLQGFAGKAASVCDVGCQAMLGNVCFKYVSGITFQHWALLNKNEAEWKPCASGRVVKL